MTRWSALLLCMLALAIGCGKSSGSASSKKSKTTNSAKTKTKETSKDLRKGPPQNVFGPYMLEEHVKNLSSKDAKARIAACKGLGYMREGAKEALPKLKKLAASDKDAAVKKEARKAIKAIAG